MTDTANPITNLSFAELIRIFDLRTHNWPDGKPITMVAMPDPSSEMVPVLGKLLNMSSSQAQAFIQAHKASIVVAASDEAVLRFVAANRGAIGIVDLYSLTKECNGYQSRWKIACRAGLFITRELGNEINWADRAHQLRALIGNLGRGGSGERCFAAEHKIDEGPRLG